MSIVEDQTLKSLTARRSIGQISQHKLSGGHRDVNDTKSDVRDGVSTDPPGATGIGWHSRRGAVHVV